jgi:hypothetical protein
MSVAGELSEKRHRLIKKGQMLGGEEFPTEA